ncbi:hypothetical protein V8F33_006732 [Rhypophila sp. PSN 637]
MPMTLGMWKLGTSTWKNHNHNWDGPIDTPKNREYDPEGFQWSCCEWDLDSPGCEHGFHRAAKEVDKVKEGRPLEDSTEAAPEAKKAKLDGNETTAKDSITGASGAAIIVANTSGKLNLPKPTQTDVNPKTVPEGRSVCLQCKELYWEGSNRPRSCWFHDGSLILDSGKEVWEMFDYDREDEIDNDEMREEVPEGFYYECCGESGLSKGCKWGSHVSNRNPPDTGRTGTMADMDTGRGANGDKKNQSVTDVQDLISGETSCLSSV